MRIEMNVTTGEIVEFSDAPIIETTPLTAKKIALNSILALESTVTERRTREAILGIDGGWLANVNAQIATLRGVQ